MKHWKLAVASTAAVSAGMLLYGAIVEANRLVVERITLPVPFWPEELRGYKIALLADFHVRGPHSLKLCQKAVAAALESEPDMVAIVGDVVGHWSKAMPPLLRELLEPLMLMNGAVVAIPGNHDYELGDPELLGDVCRQLNIRFLRNESWIQGGVTWVGVDSATMFESDPEKAMEGVWAPAICLWHEPDLVHRLPAGCSLMLSGHSHGGQFRFPGGFTPMHTALGKKYPRGYFSNAPTPLYVSRGIGTTGPPSRFLCPPEVAILTLVPQDL